MSQPFKAAQVRDALLVLKREGGDPWPLIESFMIQASATIEKLETALRFVAAKCREAGVIAMPGAAAAPVANAATDVEVAPPVPNGTRIGADGSPLDPAQSAIEDAMDAAIAAGGGQPAPAQRTRPAPQPGQPAAVQRPMPPRGGVRMPPPGAAVAPPPPPANGEVRIGADGTPITDPAQLAAEAAMDAALAAD